MSLSLALHHAVEEAADDLTTTIADESSLYDDPRSKAHVFAVVVAAARTQLADPYAVACAVIDGFTAEEFKAAERAADDIASPWGELRGWAKDPSIVDLFKGLIRAHGDGEKIGKPTRVDLGQMVRDGVPRARPLEGSTGLCGRFVLRNQVAGFQGHPEAMKSTFAAACGLDYMRAGGNFVWMDWENGEEEAARKLLDLAKGLGLRDEELAVLLSEHLDYRYMNGQEPDWDEAAEIAADYPDALWLWDSARGIIRSYGGNEDVAKDVGRFMDPLDGFRLREDVAACILIDHVTKASNSGTRYARGSGDKLAAVQVTWYFDVPTGHQPSRTKAGKVNATKHKDRSGDLEGFHTFKVGDARGALAITTGSARDNANGQREAAVIALLQREFPAVLSMKQIREAKHEGKRAVSGRTDTVTACVEALAADSSQPVNVVDGGYQGVPG